MPQRVTKPQAAALLGVSSSTINRMIQRGDLPIEKVPHGSRYRVWVLINEKSPGKLSEGSGGSSSDQSDIVELTTLRERVRSLEELADHHGEQLKESELRYQQVLQQLESSQQRIESLTQESPAPDAGDNSIARRIWGPFRKRRR